jgi:hypothetical protein
MQKILSLLFAFLFIAFAAAAQDLGKVLWGLKAGYNLNTANYVTNQKLPVKWAHGGYGGLMMKVPFDNRLFFVPQVDVTYRAMFTDSLQKEEYSEITEWHMRVAPLLQIEFTNPVKKTNTLFFQFGPSIGFGITGNQVLQNAANTPAKKKLKYGFNAYGRYDANAHAALGYESKAGFRLMLEYVHGLGNMINTEDRGTLKYRTLSIGIGYWLGKNRSK